MTTEENFEQLTHTQRLKAAVHHTTLKICRDTCEQKNVKLNRMVVAAISETAWKKCEQFAVDLECFAKHAKRTTINADDVKMLVRKSPKLHDYISGMQEELNASKAETKKKTKKSKTKDTAASVTTSHVKTMDVDEDSGS